MKAIKFHMDYVKDVEHELRTYGWKMNDEGNITCPKCNKSETSND